MKKCDTLILGNIITLDTDETIVKAMACKDGLIVYVGDEQTARKLCDENTKVLDYTGKYIYPGFFDSHTHGCVAGQRMKFQCALNGGNSMQEYADKMKKYVEENPGRSSYQGAGWVKKGDINVSMLDEISKDIPIILSSADGHSVWVNSACLKDCGFDAAKAKELGTDIVHVDENGNPTGWISESAAMAIMGKYAPSKEDIKEGLLAWQEFAFANGMTAVVDAAGDAFKQTQVAYKELVDEGKWKLRTYAYNVHKDCMFEADKFVDAIKNDMATYNSEYFKVMGGKMFVDGVVEAHTAYLVDGYEDDPDYHGVFNYVGNEEIIKEVVEKLNAENIPVHFHTIGDAAVKFAMDCIEQSQINNCNFTVKNCLAHLEIVKPEDIKRIAEYNAIAIVAPLWVPVDKAYFAPEVEYLGEDRAYNTYPVKSFEDAGATICFHTDYPVTSIVGYPKAFYIAKKRRDPNKGAKSVKNPDEGISQIRSLLAITANAAYMVNEHNHLGKLLPGMVANCVVYEGNLLDENIENVPDCKLIATVVDANVVYESK